MYNKKNKHRLYFVFKIFFERVKSRFNWSKYTSSMESPGAFLKSKTKFLHLLVLYQLKSKTRVKLIWLFHPLPSASLSAADSSRDVFAVGKEGHTQMLYAKPSKAAFHEHSF